MAQWSGDARKEIHTLVDELNSTGDGFAFSKDLVLKAGLMLTLFFQAGIWVSAAAMAWLERRRRRTASIVATAVLIYLVVYSLAAPFTLPAGSK